MTGNATVVIEDLTKTYAQGRERRPALQGLSLTVDRGEWVAVVGPSGCGKSTLLHLVGGLDTPDHGRVTVAGDEVTAMSAGARAVLRRRRVGFVFQSYNLVGHLTAAANVELPLRVAGASRRAARARAAEVLAALSLTDLARARPATLSGGQQQRVAIARALAGRPDVLLADEPTGALDGESSRTVVDLLRAENARGQTVVMVTHDYAIASVADRIVFLRDGRVAEERRMEAPPGGPSADVSEAGLPGVDDLLGLGNAW
jgi:putative ABC transport system ATP-binding protein